MFNILLQIDSAAISTSSAGKESLFSLLVKGGVLMIVAVPFYRVSEIRKIMIRSKLQT